VMARERVAVEAIERTKSGAMTLASGSDASTIEVVVTKSNRKALEIGVPTQQRHVSQCLASSLVVRRPQSSLWFRSISSRLSKHASYSLFG
jgi:hypothetical protein